MTAENRMDSIGTSHCPDTDKQGDTGSILLLMALTALGQLATNIVVPSLHDIAGAVALPEASVGLILSMVLLGLAIGQLVVGPLSDTLGRRPVLLAGLAIYLAGSAGATFAPNGTWLLIARLVQGLGASAGLALPRAILRDRYQGAHFLKMTALLTMSMSVTPGLAPVLGGLITEYVNWRTSLAVSLVAGLIALAASLFWLEETHHTRSQTGMRTILHSYREVLGNGAFLANAFVAGAGIGGAYASVALAQRFYTGEFGWSSTQLSLATACYAAFFVVGSLMAARLKSSARMRIGIALMILAPTLLLVLLTTGLRSPWLTLGLTLLSQIGMGFMMAVSIGHALMSVERSAGTASAVLGAIHMVVGASGAAVVAALPFAAAWSIPLTMLGFALLSALAHLISERG